MSFRTWCGMLMAAVCVGVSGADEPAHATAHRNANIEVTINEANAAKDAVKNKKAVMSQMMRLFLERKPPIALGGRDFTEAPPEFKEIPGTNGMTTLIYRCRYVDPEFLTDALEAVATDAGSVELVKKVGSEANEYSTILIYDKTEKMAEMRQVLLGLDILQPQVLVEAQVIEVYSEQGAERDVSLTYVHYDAEYDTTNKYGFNLDSPVQNRNVNEGGIVNFVPYAFNSADGSTGRLNAALRWLDTSRDARLLSAPNVIADQGSEATITTAEELPIPETTAVSSSTNLSFTYKQVGVTLKISPKVINGKTVQLSVNPQVRSVLRYDTFTQNNVDSNIPVISVRSVDTRLTVADGDIIILGGLYNSEKYHTLRKVPYIGDIPVLSDLINGRDSNTVDKQLVFLLKVHVLQPGKLKSFDLEDTASQVHKAAEFMRQSRKLFTNRPASDFVDFEVDLNNEGKNRIEERENRRDLLKTLRENPNGKQ